MSLIQAVGLTKSFRQALKKPGLLGAVQHLFSQTYTEKVVVDHIDLTIDQGDTVAYIGPNGAGKSTTIKMLTGILVPTAGHVVVDGLVPHKHRTENAKKIGAVFGQRTQLWWDIPTRETFSLLKDIFDIPQAVYAENMRYFCQVLELDEFIHLSPRKLSLGQRMRADLAAALLHNPKIVYLDEPTIGLDIVVKERVREFIKRINTDLGVTVLLTTHDISDIKELCRRVIVIDDGRIIYDDLLTRIQSMLRERTIHVTFSEALSDWSLVHERLPNTLITPNNGGLSITFDRFATTPAEVINRLLTLGEISDFTIDEPDIDLFVKKIYNGTMI